MYHEEKDFSQTNLTMVLSIDILPTDELYPALKVANGILGQYPTSRLFQIVREKNSLCYSIYSNLISYDGACVITTGIQRENVNTTIQLIKEQIEYCKDGNYSDELIDVTKTMLVNSLQTSLDESSSLIGYAYSNALLRREYPIEKNIQDVLDVTREQLTEVFNKIKYAGSFVLYGKENEK